MIWNIPKNIVWMIILFVCLLLSLLYLAVFYDDRSSEQSLMYKLHEEQAGYKEKEREMNIKYNEHKQKAMEHEKIASEYQMSWEYYRKQSEAVSHKIEDIVSSGDMFLSAPYDIDAISTVSGFVESKKEEDIKKKLSDWEIIEHRQIIIHHTATDPKVSMDTIKANRDRKYGWPASHFIIASDWSHEKLIETEMVAGTTRDLGANYYSVQIELIGNFEEWPPTIAQYAKLRTIIGRIKEKHGDLDIIGHNDVDKNSNTSCPGKFFNWDILYGNDVDFALSRYYSVMTGQTRYYNGRTYEEDFEVNCSGDCLITAKGVRLTNDKRYKYVACSKEYPLWSMIDLWDGLVVECVDRWGAIVDNRLDMRCGIGDSALDYRDSCPTGKKKGIVIIK